MFSSIYLWLSLSLGLVVCFLIYLFKVSFLKKLDASIDSVSSEVVEAEKLRKECLAVLLNVQKEYREVNKKVAAIQLENKENLREMKERFLKDTEVILEAQKLHLAHEIRQMREDCKQELIAYVSDQLLARIRDSYKNGDSSVQSYAKNALDAFRLLSRS